MKKFKQSVLDIRDLSSEVAIELTLFLEDCGIKLLDNQYISALMFEEDNENEMFEETFRALTLDFIKEMMEIGIVKPAILYRNGNISTFYIRNEMWKIKRLVIFTEDNETEKNKMNNITEIGKTFIPSDANLKGLNIITTDPKTILSKFQTNKQLEKNLSVKDFLVP